MYDLSLQFSLSYKLQVFQHSGINLLRAKLTMFKTTNRLWYRSYSRNRIPRQTPFQILGVSESSSKKEIKDRYYDLCKQFHPDAAGGDTRRFQEINRAYQIVSNKSRREMYSRYGDQWEGDNRSHQRQPDDGEVASQTRNSVLTGIGFAMFVAWYMH